MFLSMLTTIEITLFITIFAMFITIYLYFCLHQFNGYGRVIIRVINTNVDNFSP